jgi:hypothetical protein
MKYGNKIMEKTFQVIVQGDIGEEALKVDPLLLTSTEMGWRRYFG